MTIDNTLSDDHVNNVCKAAHFHIRALRHIRRCVSVYAAKTVATALMSSRLDYCNSILYGTSSSNLNKLQRVGPTERPSAYRRDDQKTLSHHTGVSPSSLAPCYAYCPHSVQNSTADIQDTHYPSTELHTRPTPAALLVTTTQVHQSQPTRNSAD